MRLRGTEFGVVLGASGVQGFFGEPYWWHAYASYSALRRFKLDFSGMTFVAKTTTLYERIPPDLGHMELADDKMSPRDKFPKQIRWNFLHGIALNALGVPGPGLEALLNKGEWQRRTEPFMISLMSVADSPEEREDEYHGMVAMLLPRLYEFNAPFAIQLNESCPNTNHDPSVLAKETLRHLDILSDLDLPLVVKGNLLWSREFAFEIALHNACDAILMGNTIPWKRLEELRINPVRISRLLGSSGGISPLAKYGGGGLSGKLLYEYVLNWCRDAHNMGINIPLIACGGIMTHWDAEYILRNRIVDAVSLGTMVMLRWWRVQRTIRKTNQGFLERS